MVVVTSDFHSVVVVVFQQSDLGLEDFDLGMKAETSRSPKRFEHGNGLVGFADPGVDFQFTVAICCRFTAKVNKLSHIL